MVKGVYTPIMARSIHQLKPGSAAREAAGCACFNLRKAARAITQLYDGALAPSGLRATQFSLLAVLRAMGEPTISRLAKAMVMDRTTLTRNLRPLEKLGLLEVIVGKDRRTRHVGLTALGRDRLATAFPLWREAQARVARGLGEARRERLLSDLAGVVAVAHPV